MSITHTRSGRNLVAKCEKYNRTNKIFDQGGSFGLKKIDTFVSYPSMRPRILLEVMQALVRSSKPSFGGILLAVLGLFNMNPAGCRQNDLNFLGERDQDRSIKSA